VPASVAAATSLWLQIVASLWRSTGHAWNIEVSGIQSSGNPDQQDAHRALVRAAAVLVMDDTGSVGLDLSFAGAVFLMEPLADAALEQQVVSRAHRMGADPKRPILVETLVMKVRRCCTSSNVVKTVDMWVENDLILGPLRICSSSRWGHLRNFTL
jgi:hypothetical protein